MGASEWTYRTGFAGDIEAALEALQHKVFAEGAWFWAPEWRTGGTIDGGPKPTTMAALLDNELAQETGTHSIIDVFRVIGADDADDVGTVRPLTGTELDEHFGTREPTPERFEELRAAGSLPDLTPRWSGNCALLFTGGEPTEIAFWGYSGD